MIKEGSDIRFQDPGSEERNLHHSSVIEIDATSFVVEFAGTPISLAVDDEVIVYFDDSDEFMQQVVRIGEIVREEPHLAVALIPVGDATSAESRQHYRVSTIAAEIHANIGDETQCSVQDVSSTGFAVVAGATYKVGTTVEVSIEFEGDFFGGTVSIQSVRELRPGRCRYGLRALDTGIEGSELLEGLGQINLAIQRSQAKRSA